MATQATLTDTIDAVDQTLKPGHSVNDLLRASSDGRIHQITPEAALIYDVMVLIAKNLDKQTFVLKDAINTLTNELQRPERFNSRQAGML